MKKEFWIKKVVSALISSLLVLSVAMIVQFLVGGLQITAIRQYFKPQFTYVFPDDNRPVWAGPRIGERVNLDWFQISENQDYVAPTGRTSFTLLTIINEDCWASRTASDQIQFVQNETNNLGVDSLVVTLNRHSSLRDVEALAASFGLQPRAGVLRQEHITDVPESVALMVVPSFILLSSDGTVLKSFPGTHLDADVRRAMGAQVILELKDLTSRPRNSSDGLIRD